MEDNKLISEITHEEEILALVRDENLETSVFHDQIMEYHPFDIARVFEELDKEERMKFYVALSPSEIAPIFEHLDHEKIPTYFSELSIKYCVKILEYMEIDETVDILRNFSDEKLRASYISLIKPEIAKEIKGLLSYDDEVTGSIMSTSYIELRQDMLVKDAMKHMIHQAREIDYINTMFVIDKKERLVGVLSLKELIVATKEESIADIMTEKIISIEASEPKEDAAELFSDYDLDALPVVDSENRLLGIVTSDDIIDVIEEEAVEDYAKFAGIIDGEIQYGKEAVFKSVRKRIPWLVILLGIGIIASIIIGQFEETLAAIPILAMFLPMMLDMAGNVGTQSLAVTIRLLTDDDFLNRKNIRRHFMRELSIGLINGFIIATLAFIITTILLSIRGGAFLDGESLRTGLVIGVSMFASITTANLAGSLVPLAIFAFKIDPAVASGPFITTLNDIMALTIYFTMASALLLNYL